MHLSGSSDENGVIYKTYLGEIDYNMPVGSFQDNTIYSGKLDMYSKHQTVTSVAESGAGIQSAQNSEYDFEKSPYNPLNYGLRFGLTYELSGFQLGVHYNLPLSNMANDAFWNSNRIPVINGKIGENNMSGYKQKISCLSVTLGYVFRY